MANKVCVYTICKNESIHVARWLDSVEDADLIYVTDTGSEDNTIEIFEAIKEDQFMDNLVIDHYPKTDHFNFAEARNFSLRAAKKYIKENIPGDCDWVYVAMDLDEFLYDGAIDIIRTKWSPEYDTLFTRAKVASTGEIFDVRHKIHGEGVEWHRSIHEILDFNGRKEATWNCPDFGIFYIHDQDFSKERNYYEMLLDAFNIFGDRSVKTLTYLAQESLNRNKLDDAFKFTTLAYDVIFRDESDPYYKDAGYIICLRYYFASYYNEMKEYEKAYSCISLIMDMFAKGEFPHIRNLYKLAAEICWSLCSEYKKNENVDMTHYIHLMYYRTLFYYTFMLTIDDKPIRDTKAFWLENYDLYSKKEESLVYNSISITYYDMGLYRESLVYLNLAANTDDTYKDLFESNRKWIEDKL